MFYFTKERTLHYVSTIIMKPKKNCVLIATNLLLVDVLSPWTRSSIPLILIAPSAKNHWILLIVDSRNELKNLIVVPVS